jgi:hypothetical protein
MGYYYSSQYKFNNGTRSVYSAYDMKVAVKKIYADAQLSAYAPSDSEIDSVVRTYLSNGKGTTGLLNYYKSKLLQAASKKTASLLA